MSHYLDDLKQSNSDAFILASAYRDRYMHQCRMGNGHLPIARLYKDRMDFWSEVACEEIFGDVQYEILVRVK